MSSQTVRCLAVATCSLTLCLLVAGFGRAGDPFQDEAQKKELEAQKLEKDVRENMAEAAKNSADTAIALLNAVRERVSEDTNLKPERRSQLLNQIDARIKVAGQAATTPLPIERPRPTDAGRRDRDADKARQDQKTVADKIFKDRNDAIVKGNDLKDQRSEAQLKVDRDVEKSMVAMVDPIAFPKNWEELSKKRTKPRLTEREEKLLKALNTPLKNIDFDKMNLKDVLQYLQDKTGETIFIPKAIMEEVSIGYETPVTFKSPGDLTFRSVLKKVLGDLNLTYVIKEGSLQVTTPERAKTMYTTRAYYVGDLAPIADIRLGPIGQRLVMAQTIALLMQTIIQTVEPNSWQANNPDAGGTILFEPVTMQIVVKQTAEMHLMLGGSLGR